MKRLTLILGGGMLASASVVSAHPLNQPYETRGECEAAYAESSKLDRERLVELGTFDTKGDAQKTFRDIFRCEYDENDQAWYIVFIGSM